MISRMILLVLSIVSIGLSSAQLIQDLKCDPSITLQVNFNVTKFLEKWNVVRRTELLGQPIECSDLEIVEENNQLYLNERVINQNFPEELKSPATYQDTAKFSVNRSNSNELADFWILETDYINYALAYSCEDVDSSRKVTIWQLGRPSTTPTEMMNASMNQKLLTSFGITRDDLIIVDRSETTCKILPDIPPGQNIILPGQCDPYMPVVQNFNVIAFTGRWFSISSYYSTNQGGKCGRAQYTLSEGEVFVENSMVVDQQLEVIRGTASVNTTDGSARLLVTLEVVPGIFVDSPLWVLATDYEEYAVSYTCVNQTNNQKKVNAWILSRTRQLTDKAKIAVEEIISREVDLNKNFFTEDDQGDNSCFYYPEHDPKRPVVFRGQCERNNVTAMQNFDAVAYMGLWHNIESYPSVSSSGACNNALYTLKEGFVDVFNTQVVNEQLLTINGVARVASTDGSARLTVEFPIAGTDSNSTADYWVLDTDYKSYALVYSCRNIDDEYQQVTSFKLSRTKDLPTIANITISEVMKDVKVLDQRYFEENNQSPEGCFYFPEPQPGLPVKFRGQCDMDIQAIANFNMTRFQGIWHEIQAYPKIQQTGQCVNHNYTYVGNTLDLITTSVLDQAQSVTKSQVTFTSPQQTSGRLTITLTSGGSEIQIPFWIIDTDYVNYALAYSCVNASDDYRQVFSWKLSRTQQLTLEDNASIDRAMQNISVLQDIYFEPIQQTDEYCFYLPKHVPGQPVTFYGKCDENIAVVQNFDAAQYLGRWRRISSYPEPSQFGKCSQATYSLNADGSTVDVYNTQVVNGQLDYINGTAVLNSTDGSAKLAVSFPITTEAAPYWILATDYETFALVYSCRNLPNNQRRVTAWKLSRSDQLSEKANQSINEVVNRINVLNEDYFEMDDQSDEACFYFPPPGPNAPIFRGQCDDDIPVVSNFNPGAYLGQWYDLASYSTVFQQGTCNSAYYSSGERGVDVFNTQVINQRLDTMIGIAEVVSTDGSAKLNVTFPIAGTNNTITTPYWVLATDYRTYSLVYTCVNRDSEHRQVWSWKLSRTTNLTDEAVNAISNTMATIQVLDEQYYVTRNHSREGCFYYPEPEEGKPVVFRGQCESSIQAVAYLNMSAFQGVWHEIEAYPKDQQSGQCINHVYTSTGNGMDLVSSNVIDQIRSVTNSRVTFASTEDDSGRLNITFTSEGLPITIPFWILSVDYNDHALAYSCVNINETHKGVYSWKLSRTQELSSIGSAAIDVKINEIDVLDQMYYEKIGQSDRDCFHLPDPVPGLPVEFPGQCDEDLPVVQNFDPVAYGGRWRMIETYPSEFQTNGSTCLEATYTLTDAGTVDVYNTEVLDQRLLTINGTAALASTDGSAKLTVSFPGAPENATYWVLSTDYESYALVYSCRNTGPNNRTVYTWKLSRTRELTENARNQINQIINQVDVLNEKYYEKIAHSDDACFYYPTPDGNPVIFRGQCNQSIPVVPNFDAEAYNGTWYDIEGYPVQFQNGTCPTATYTTGGPAVDVFNTQVVDQWLDTIRGTAVVASEDGSAKLNVTFPVAGTNLTIDTPYWVLATNYSDFALVYTCVDINPEYQRVASWKLSRTKTLSPQSRDEIDKVVATIPVLKEDYYEVRGHTEEDCFFYPDNEGGPVIQDGQCESAGVNVVDRFSITAFSGRWYEISRFPSETQEGGCVSEDFVVRNQSISVHQTYVFNERQRTDSGPVTLSPDGRGIFTVNITDPVGGGITQATFHVLAVSYNDFALLYSCRNIGNTSRQIFSWKLSRSQSGLSQVAVTKINQIVRDTLPLSEHYYETTDQTINGCFYYPRFDELPPTIELLGPCDTRIRAKADFDVAAYLGKWYEIASYPQPFQFGQCARAQYNLGNGAVDVINTQVVNKTLDVQLATAVVASDDGSGLLNVTFNLPGGVVNVVNYYVLESDYANFSLVYSCSNTSDGNRRVTSWILSRQPTLSEEATPIIASIINSTQGLDPDYYQLTSQTADDCFYIPELDKNEAPRFRGQCGNVTGVQGFDIQRYLGWWHEIESYPTDNDRGTCISSEYIQIQNEYHVVDTNIFNNAAQVNTSVVTATTDGRIRKVSNGEVTDIWVLATDYETYSLLYSCENIDSQYKRVWSAKHSKSRELTQAAQDTISKYIEATRTLETQFYQVVDQSDSSCFHLPEQTTDNQIILPGQCDLNIPVVQNFNVSAYGGTWYQIERYPQIHENGTCIGARYTLNENTGVVAVLNWQVVNGTLDQVEGTATLNSTDGSAKLIVTLPIRFTEESEPTMVSMELYVLTTDYVTHSLAYSCVNVGPFRRAVGAWKLSRTRSLATESSAAINLVMANREELEQRWFEPVEQRDDCPEPSSAMLVKSSIIIMLICSILHYAL